jgi:hypothetical protein
MLVDNIKKYIVQVPRYYNDIFINDIRAKVILNQAK